MRIADEDRTSIPKKSRNRRVTPSPDQSSSPAESPRSESAWLVECFRQGDERAAEALFARYFSRLTALVRARLSAKLQARVDADDVVQSTYRSFFVRASAGQFELDASGDLWRLLARMALHKLSHQIERHTAEKRAVSAEESLSDAHEIASPGPSPDEAAAIADELEFVMRSLSPTERRTLELRLQGELIEAIALDLGQSERTVRRTLAHVREIMVRRLPTAEREAAQQSQPKLPEVESTAMIATSLTSLDYADLILKQHIGEGLTGKVYRAWWKSRSREVAVKYLRREHLQYPERIERFCDEASLVMSLQHPNVAAVRGLGRAPHGGFFIVLDWIDGPNLQTLLGQSRVHQTPLAVEDVIRWMTDAARAVQHAHERGVIHCDLKPGNLLLASDGRVVLTDFGFARRLTANSGRSLDGGTLAFMAPEQLDPSLGEISPQTDVFGWGAVVYTLLAGQPPHPQQEGANLKLAIMAARSFDPRVVRERQVVEDLCDICAQCLSPSPLSRPATMCDVLVLLNKLRDGV